MKNFTSLLSGKNHLFHTALISIIHFAGIYRIMKETDYPFARSELFVFILVIMFITAASYFLLKYFLKDKIKAAVVTTLFLGFGFNIIPLGKLLTGDNFLPGLSEASFSGNQFYTSVALLLLIFFLLGIIVRKIPFTLTRFSNYLNVLLLIFLSFELIKFFTFEPKRIELEEKITVSQNPAEEAENLPDIYYIIFDSYTSFNSLNKYWDYDNREVYDFLKNRDFYVAPGSNSSYNQTHFTLASTFNLSYLHYDSFNELITAHYPNLFRLIKDNIFVKILRQHGYKIINLSLFDIALTQKFYRFDLIDEPGFLKNTLFEHAIDTELIGSMIGFNFKPDIRRHRITNEITTRFKEAVLENQNEKVFVYAHFMIPHSPYYFDAKGNLMPDDYSSDKNDMWKYLKQLKFSNRILMETVDFILSNSEEKPVIIIQGDHGFRSLEDKKERGAESHSILNAFYFPDCDYSLLYPSISSVNTFRSLLKKYGLADIEFLPDKRFFVAKGIGF